MNQCMIFEDHKRINFKEILDVLDPDLKCDFKQKSFYHNEFKKKQTIKRKPSSEHEHTKIADPSADFDNYI